MLLDVKLLFDEYLKKNFGHKPAVLDFLLHHERKELCIRNLCESIRVAEKRTKIKLNMDREKYRFSIEEVAKAFAYAAVKARTAELTTAAERHRREAELTKYDEIKSCVKGLDDEGPIDSTSSDGRDSGDPLS